MAFIVPEFASETCDAPGTGGPTLLGKDASRPCRTFDNALNTGDTTYYVMSDGLPGGQSEICSGTYTSTSNTLTRTTIMTTAGNTTPLNFSGKDVKVFAGFPTSKLLLLDVSNNLSLPGKVTVTGAATASSTLAVTGATTLASTLSVSGATTATSLTATGVISTTAVSGTTVSGWILQSSGTSSFGPSGYTYGVLANATNMLAGAYVAASDGDLKSDIQEIDGQRAMHWLETARPVEYKKRPSYSASMDESVPEAGFIAQDVVAAGYGQYVQAVPSPGMPVRPEIGMPADTMMALANGYGIPFLTAALKELAASNRDLVVRVASLESALSTEAP